MKKELLQSLATEVRAPIEQEWSRLALENRLLRELIRQMRIEKYGPKSEQLSDRQLALLDLEPGVAAEEIETEAQRSGEESEGLEDPAATPKPARRPHPGRRELPAHLPRVEKVLACTPEQCCCAGCGAETKVIGYDVSEELDVKPAEFFVTVVKREKRACGKCVSRTVLAAALPAKIIDKGLASNSVIVDVIIKKYMDHLPLYRQAAMFSRDAGLELSRMTLCGWVIKSGVWLQAIGGAMRADLLTGSYIQADETTVGVQTEKKTGSNHKAYLWQYSRPNGPVVFDFQMGRSRENPKKFLGNYAGLLQSDGYNAYEKIGGPKITFCGCMAHVRRGFVDALKVSPDESAAAQIVSLIGKLYAVEKKAREGQLTAAQRQALRGVESAPVMEELKKKITAAGETALPQSGLGKACTYALGQWDRILVYLQHGEVEIDNNWCENAMRPTVLGRKNWLHIGSEEAGPPIAAIISVLETCRRLGVNPRTYLLDVLPKIPAWPINRIAELTPMAWAAAHPPA